jgi:hypothetical protein
MVPLLLFPVKSEYPIFEKKKHKIEVSKIFYK